MIRRSPLLTLLVLTGCVAGGPGAVPPVGTALVLPRWLPAGPGVGAPSPTASPEEAPVSPTPEVNATPTPVATPSPRGGGGSSGGGLTVPVAPPEVPLDTLGGVSLGVDGPVFPLPAGLSGSLSLELTDYVLSTLVVDGTARITETHPTSLFGVVAPTGSATVTGSLGVAGAGFVVSFRAAGGGPFVGATADETGEFSFSVPVNDTRTGVVIATERGDRPTLGLQRATVTAGETLTLPAFDFVAPSPADEFGPAVPEGLGAAAGRLTLLDGDQRLDLAAFTSGIVPGYSLPGFSLARVYEAVGAGSGSAVVTTTTAPAYMPPPDLSAIPMRLVPGASIGWPAVPGATLYTATLQRAGDAALTWEGVSTYSAIRLPTALPTGWTDMTLTVAAWASDEITLFSVASLRQLRLPEAPSRAGGRHSWRVRSGLSTQ